MVWHGGSYATIFTLEKRLLFESGINQIMIKQLKLYAVMCYFIKTCMLSTNFKVALIISYGF